jgi:DNA-binding IclR family transcriptional regulator
MTTNRSVERAISILIYVCQSDRPVGLTEISRGTGLDKATVLRFLNTLANSDMVRTEVDSKRYVQGPGIYNFWPSEIRKICRPHLQALLDQTQETICLIVPRGVKRVCIDAVEPDRELRIVAPVGRELPIYAGASGRVFMAQKTDEQIDKILEDSNLTPLTEKSTDDKEIYRAQLLDVRQKGYAQNVGEVALDTVAIAAPVFDGLGNTAAAVVIRGPSSRISGQTVEGFSTAVLATAKAISGELTHIHK